MHKPFFALFMMALALPLAANAADSTVRGQCERCATKDRVAADEMENYLKDCVAYLTKNPHPTEECNDRTVVKETPQRPK